MIRARLSRRCYWKCFWSFLGTIELLIWTAGPLFNQISVIFHFSFKNRPKKRDFSPKSFGNTVEISGSEISTGNKFFITWKTFCTFSEGNWTKTRFCALDWSSFHFRQKVLKFEDFLKKISKFRYAAKTAENCRKSQTFERDQKLNEESYETFEDGVGKLRVYIFQKFYLATPQKFLR